MNKKLIIELDKEGLLEHYLFGDLFQESNNSSFKEPLNDYSEEEIIAYCSEYYSEEEVLNWLDQEINYDLIIECVQKHDIWA